MNGWIKFYRQFEKWEWYQKSEMVHLFLHLLLGANHEQGSWQGIKIERGQIVVGRNKLAKETGISPQTIRTCIERLKLTKEITTKPTNKYTIITIVNYDKYQDDERKSTNKTPHEQQTTNQQLTTNNNNNNINNTTVPNGTTAIAFTKNGKTETHLIMPNYEELNDGDVTYGDDPDCAPIRPKSKSKYGKRKMSVLARCYLQTAKIKPTCPTCEGKGQLMGEVGTLRRCLHCGGTGEYFNASRFMKPLSQLLEHCDGDADKVIALIKKAGEYFESQSLSWNLETVNRDHEMIDKWTLNGARKKELTTPKLDISERRIIE